MPSTLGLLMDPWPSPWPWSRWCAAGAGLLARVPGEEPKASLGRYYLYQSLFAFSMLGLVFGLASPDPRLLGAGGPVLLSPDRLLLPAAGGGPAAASRPSGDEAGDVGFLVGIVLLWGTPGRSSSWTLSRRLHGTPGRTLPSAGALMFWARSARAPSSPPRLAPRRDGGPDPGLRPHPRGHHGHGRRVPGGPPLPALRPLHDGAPHEALGRRP